MFYKIIEYCDFGKKEEESGIFNSKKIALKKIKIMETKELIEKYEFICNELVAKFEEKQQIEFEGWIGDEIGGLASFSFQYFFNLADIILDLKTNQPKGCIINWSEEETDFNLFNENPHYINYKSYTMGLRHENLVKKVEKLSKKFIKTK